LAALRGWGLSEKIGSCDSEPQPVKITAVANHAQANNPRTINFMGANPCESAGAINTFV
jgi:hypothetical protein